MDETSLLEILAENLRLAMARSGFASQAELARRAHIPQTTLNLLMNPQRQKGYPTLKHLVTLAEVFDMEVWELLCPLSDAERRLMKSFEDWVKSKR